MDNSPDLSDACAPRFTVAVFDRPAFRTPFQQAIEDTFGALDTGV